MQENLDSIKEALGKARDMFIAYANYHEAKGDNISKGKAKTNRAYANTQDKALITLQELREEVAAAKCALNAIAEGFNTGDWVSRNCDPSVLIESYDHKTKIAKQALGEVW